MAWSGGVVPESREAPTVLELFAGAGGMAVGLHMAGFRHLALLEKDSSAVSTLKVNAASGTGVRPELEIGCVDVHQFRYEAVASEVDLLAAGAPCQPFSLAGNHLGDEDERNLFPEVFRAQRALVPRALLLENVWGLARPGFRPYLEYLLLRLARPLSEPRRGESWRQHKQRLLAKGRAGGELTYDVNIAAIECANFGVPQRRNRLFVVAFRTDLEVGWEWPEANHDEYELLLAKVATGTYWREHGVPPRYGGRVGQESKLVPTGRKRWRTVRDVLRGLPVPDRPDAREKHHPNHYRIDGCREYRGHTGSEMDQPAKTLKAGVHGVPGGEDMVRFSNGMLRYFSLHESALLQTFPPEYVFIGTRSAAIRQIGNAAPVEVVHRVGRLIQQKLAGAPVVCGSAFRVPRVNLADGVALLQL
jgi:DNA (cytosine-5)-methyltransferase 1